MYIFTSFFLGDVYRIFVQGKKYCQESRPANSHSFGWRLQHFRLIFSINPNLYWLYRVSSILCSTCNTARVSYEILSPHPPQVFIGLTGCGPLAELPANLWLFLPHAPKQHQVIVSSGGNTRFDLMPNTKEYVTSKTS